VARIRTIKPGFWSDESVVSLPFEYRLLFQGLWNFADDEGFIENRPGQIKLDVFPVDDVDITRGIKELRRAKLIRVVRLGDKSVILVLNWKKHQRIDKPQPSAFAEQYAIYQARCPDTRGSIPGTFQERSQNIPAGGDRKGREGKGEEGKGKEDTQVGGGGYLSSDKPQPPPPPTSIYQPWRCEDHQGVDAKCFACKDAKASHKAAEAERVKTERKRKEDDAARVLEEREARLDAQEAAKREALDAPRRIPE
jgi:hypothetical protein